MTGRGQKSSSQGRSAGEKRLPSTISHWRFDNWGLKHAHELHDIQAGNAHAAAALFAVPEENAPVFELDNAAV